MHEHLRRLRSREPVYYSGSLRTWFTTTYADCELLFRDPRFVKRGWTRMVEASFGGDTVLADFLFFKDPPEHTRLRRLVQKKFKHATAAALAARSAETVEHLLDGLRRDGGGDLVKDFAWKVPMPVIGSLFDVPRGDSAMIEAWGRDMFLATDMTRPDQLPAGKQALAEMYEYFVAHVHRTCDADGFIGSLAATSMDGDRLSEHELALMCMQMLIGGYDTTAHQIASAAHLLLSNPEQLHHLRQDWSLLDNAVEEILRCEPSAPFVGREAAQDVILGDKTIRAGELIGPLIAAANRDPERFVDPERFDILTSRPAHLGFGIGSRRCLGEHLARLHLRTAITRLFDGGITLTLDEQPARWRPSLLFRGLESLPAHVA
ncbi:MAG: cytochrome P450 [Frankia sp.]